MLSLIDTGNMTALGNS